jgi:serine/threonine-protein kinase RsbW
MTKIRVERISEGEKFIRIRLSEEFHPQKDLRLLENVVENLIAVKGLKILLDFMHLKHLPSSFISYLIEITGRARRNGGDVYLLNVSPTLRGDFLAFNPLAFLRVADEGEVGDFHNDPAGDLNFAGIEGRLHGSKEGGTESSADDLESSLSLDSILNLDIDSELSEKDNGAETETALPAPQVPSSFAEEEDEFESERLVVHSREDQLYRLTDFVERFARKVGFGDTEVSRIKISVYEAAHNIIEHAYGYDPNRVIEMYVKREGDEFRIIFFDRGKGFEYDPDRDYDAEEAVEERRTGGFGLHIIRRSMDDVIYETHPKWGNRLILVKKIR